MQTNPGLRVEVQKLRNRYVAITQDSHGQELLRNEFHYATTHLSYLGPLWLVDPDRLQPKEQRRLGRLPEDATGQAQVAEQGSYLFQCLFGNGKTLKRHLTTLLEGRQAPLARQGAAAPDIGVRMTLEFGPDAAALRRLPWEYLFDGKQFLCLDGPIMLSRSPAASRRPLQMGPAHAAGSAHIAGSAHSVGPLRVLLIIAAPTDQVKFDVEEELGIIQDALAPLIARHAVTVDLLPEPTLTILREALHTETYHLVHYVGHALYHLSQHQGYLCFEDEIGYSALTSGNQLFRFTDVSADPSGASAAVTREQSLPQGPSLFIISTCQHAQVGASDAIQSVADDLLRHGFPSVLSVPISLPAPSAQAFYRALFGDLANGEAVDTALRHGRRALHGGDGDGGDGEHTDQKGGRADWGMPVLHQYDVPITLITPAASLPADAEPDPRKLAAAVLSGHRWEIRAVRQALSAGARVFYVLGGHGVGKHTLVSYLLEHLSPKVDACLRINCQDMITPLSALIQIADFWRNDVAALDPRPDVVQAAEHLLDTRPAPRERARQAQAMIANKRTLILFEEIDAWFASPDGESGNLESGVMRDILLGLMQEPSRSVFAFTGRCRWQALSEIPMEEQREIHLPLLSEHYAIQVMNQLPVLRATAVTPEQKQEVYQTIGGHPKIHHYVDRWLAFHHTLPELTEIASHPHATTEAWLTELIAQLLDALDPGEYQVLRTLSILKLPFSAATVASLTQVAREHAMPLIEHWQRTGLVLRVPGNAHGLARYRLDGAVRAYLLGRLSPSEKRLLHRRAADTYGAPYFDAARRQVLARAITTWSEERIGWLARDTSGVLGLRLRQEEDTEEKARLVERALAWQYHLAEAGEDQAAAQIVQALVPELNRQGQQELSRELLQRTLSLPADSAIDQKLDTLMKLRLEEGSLTTALHVYEEIYKSLDPETEMLQRAHVMLRAGHVHQDLGELDDAIQHYDTALQIIRKREGHSDTAELTREEDVMAQALPLPVSERATREDKVIDQASLAAEAECLSHLATAYRLTGDLPKALVCSQGAKEYYEILDNTLKKATIEHEQGLILKLMERSESALERFVASLRLCRELGDPKCVAENLLEIGQLFDKLGKTDVAIHVIEDAIERHSYLRNPEHGALLSLLESLYDKQRRLTEAITRFRTTREKSRTEH